MQIIHYRPKLSSLHRLSTDIGVNELERRAFRFFREQSASDFSGFFGSSFWNRTVPQFCHTEPSIQHAVFALGSLHEGIQLQGLEGSGGRVRDPFALQECNKAIRHLFTTASSKGPQSDETFLMACALFICFECLQGNYNSALSHMQNGLNIFRRWQAKESGFIPSKSLQSFKPRSTVEGEIAQMFSRLNMQPLFFPNTHLFPTDVMKQDISLALDSTKDSFTSTSEARDWLDYFVSNRVQARAAAFVGSQAADDQSCANEFQDESDYHLLHEWLAIFQRFVKEKSSTFGPKDQLGVLVLKMQYQSVKIILSVPVAHEEAAFDSFETGFTSILSLATSVVLRQAPEHTARFSFETGIVPTLFFTATKCRNPWIRRQALNILSTTPRQESVWHSEILSKIVERVILIEEGRDELGQVTRTKGAAVTTRLNILNTTVYSEKRQVLIECSQRKSDAETCVIHEWITY